MKIIRIKIDEIIPNDLNPNEMTSDTYEHLEEEIKRVGFIQPIIVRKEGEKYNLIDGEHRWLIAKKLGMEDVPAIAIEMEKEEANIALVNLNRIRGEFNPIKFAILLDKLDEKFSKDRVLKVLKMSEQERNSYKLMRMLPDDISTMINSRKSDLKRFNFIVKEENIDIVEDALVKALGKTPDEKFIFICMKFLKNIENKGE